MITLLIIREHLFYNSNEVIYVKHGFAGMNKCRDRGIQKWAPFQSIPGYSKMVHDAVHNFEDKELTFDDDYHVSLDYMLSEVSNEGKKAAIKYHDGKRYRLVTGSISSFGNGKIGIDTDEGNFIELDISKIANLEPL
jgi:hypothetical protein